MVPLGMDSWASARSPDLFDPAMIPEIDPINVSTWTRACTKTRARKNEKIIFISSLGARVSKTKKWIRAVNYATQRGTRSSRDEILETGSAAAINV